MPKPNEKLAQSLTALRELQQAGQRVFQAKQFRRLDRERLAKNGFIQEVVPGWWISSTPGLRQGDSTPWYASFWEFCARYCDARFGTKWYLSPEQSLLLYAENTIIPDQVIVCSPNGTNNKIALPFGTSLYDLKQSQALLASKLIVREGLRVFVPAAALVQVSESFFKQNPIEIRVTLESTRDASEVLQHLLEGGHSTVAGRLAGAFRHINRPDIADEIIKTMKVAGYDVRESNPFGRERAFEVAPSTSPIVGRMQALWEVAREAVIEVFPPPPGLPAHPDAYLQSVEDIYRSDAYNSLSIEGYTVSPQLIEQVRSGDWNPDHTADDRQTRDALAARGYWQAFQAVKGSVAQIIAGAGAGGLVRSTHRDWYRDLFQPCVAAGLINAGALAGYRSHPVYLHGSRHVPPRWEAVRDAMPALFDLLEREPNAGVRAVLGHWLFGYIHPYPDGNGRMARFLMNAMLASGGYPWTVIRVEDRTTYLAALDSASIRTQIRPFTQLIIESMQRPAHRFAGQEP